VAQDMKEEGGLVYFNTFYLLLKFGNKVM